MDDFDREVYCLFGLPFDAMDMAAGVARIQDAASSGRRCFLSTPNLNFLIASQKDPAFRESVVLSDMSVADGMPIVWLARLLGVPIHERVAGSGLFERLRYSDAPEQESLKIYFFGGPEGVAERACEVINSEVSAMTCVGWQSPGFGSVEAISGEDRIAAINASGADFLVVALGAKKGQAWIVRNLPRLEIPVVSHLGAVVNFVAGSVSRAPPWMQRAGLEWLWRIKEEPVLWRRYWGDGLGLMRIALTQLLPLLWLSLMRSIGPRPRHEAMQVSMQEGDDETQLMLSGVLCRPALQHCREAFRRAVARHKRVVLDLTDVTEMDSAFLGLLLMLRKCLMQNGNNLHIIGVSARHRRYFRWNGVNYLLGGESSA